MLEKAYGFAVLSELASLMSIAPLVAQLPVDLTGAEEIMTSKGIFTVKIPLMTSAEIFQIFDHGFF